MHLTDGFIQSDLLLSRYTFYQFLLSLGIELMTLALRRAFGRFLKAQIFL